MHSAPTPSTALVVGGELTGEGIAGVEPAARDLEAELTAGLEERRRWQQVDLDRGHLARHQILGEIVPRPAISPSNVVGEAPDAVRDQGASEPVSVLECDLATVADLAHADNHARIATPRKTDREPQPHGPNDLGI